MKTCKTCRFWIVPVDASNDYTPHEEILSPSNPWPMEGKLPVQFEVRLCRCPDLLFCERPNKICGAAVADGSEYMANLITAEGFGCVLHELI